MGQVECSRKRAGVLAQVVDTVAPWPQRGVVLAAVDGVDGSGKSIFADQLAARVERELVELVALGAARAGGAHEISTIVAVGSPWGRDRQVLLDHHPAVRVILPTEQGIKSVPVTELTPLTAVWTVDGGTQPYDLAVFVDSSPQ